MTPVAERDRCCSISVATDLQSPSTARYTFTPPAKPEGALCQARHLQSKSLPPTVTATRNFVARWYCTCEKRSSAGWCAWLERPHGGCPCRRGRRYKACGEPCRGMLADASPGNCG